MKMADNENPKPIQFKLKKLNYNGVSGLMLILVDMTTF